MFDGSLPHTVDIFGAPGPKKKEEERMHKGRDGRGKNEMDPYSGCS
jgi:hypothetical protein